MGCPHMRNTGMSSKISLPLPNTEPGANDPAKNKVDEEAIVPKLEASQIQTNPLLCSGFYFKEFKLVSIEVSEGITYFDNIERFKDQLNAKCKSASWVSSHDKYYWVDNNTNETASKEIELCYEAFCNNPQLLNPFPLSANCSILFITNPNEILGFIYTETKEEKVVKRVMSKIARHKLSYYFASSQTNFDENYQIFISLISDGDSTHELIIPPSPEFISNSDALKNRVKEIYNVTVVSIKHNQITLRGENIEEALEFINDELLQNIYFNIKEEQEPISHTNNIESSYIKQFANIQYPNHWENTEELAKGKVLILPITRETHENEWTRIEKHAKLTIPTVIIDEISRVEYSYRWQNFINDKYMIKTHVENTNEKYLFHGTSKTDPFKIINQPMGLDVIHSNDGWYKKGIYLSPLFSYSNDYRYTVSDNKFMILYVRGLLGDIVEANKQNIGDDLPINKATNQLYDSMTDSLVHPQIYVVKRNNQAYVEYVITYHLT